MSAHEPLLVNLLGHAAGALIFGLFCAFLLRDRSIRTRASGRLSLAAGVLALIWNAGSLIDLGGFSSQWVIVIATSALSLLPAVLLHLSLEGRLRGLAWTGYGLGAVCVALHASEPFLTRPGLHRDALILTAAGFAVLTLIGGITQFRPVSSRTLAAMALLLFSLTFIHFDTEGAQSVWSLELLVHHAGIPLALVILLQDYRFVLLDAFVRVLANILLAALFTLGSAAIARRSGWVSPAFDDPRAQALALIVVCTFLVLFAVSRSFAQRLLTRLLFDREEPAVVVQRLRDGARGQTSADAYLEWAMDEIARTMRAERLSPPAEAAATIPVRLSPDDTRQLMLGRRAGGRRYLSQDLDALARWAAVAASEWNAFREAELKQLMSQAELKALQAQIHPHFLFNALNTLYGVIPKQSAAARQTVLNLADIFRYFLRTERNFLPVSAELDIVRAYLEIEQLRLGPKLRVSIDLADDAARTLIPVLSIQPLVENAVRHGIAARVEGGEIRITAALVDGALEVSVSDSGPGFSATTSDSGVGLDNVRRRLSLCYGSSSELTVTSTPEGATVSFRVPSSLPAGHGR